MRANLLRIALALLALAIAAPALAAEPTGLWLTPKRDAKIRIAPCGAALCGSIAALTEPIDKATGKPQTDVNNADPAKRSRPLMGVTILIGMKPDGADKWTGQVYNASDDGKTYKAVMTLTGPSTLKVEGCVAFFCKAENWTRSQ
jgi:uncharacterized protein (DUF2147 family)